MDRLMNKRKATGFRAGASLLAVLVCLTLGITTARAGTVTTVTYVYTNAQGSPLATANAQGTILARYTYRPYGTQQSGPTNAGPGYTGHVNDPDTGLVYMQQRYYDPAIGRFLSPDPVGPSAGNVFNIGRYTYANNNPIVITDPTGMCGQTGEVSAAVQAMRDTSDGCSGAMAEHAAATSSGGTMVGQSSRSSGVAPRSEWTQDVPNQISSMVKSSLVQSYVSALRNGHDFNAPPTGVRREHGAWVYKSTSGALLLVAMPDSTDPVTGVYNRIQAGDPPGINGYSAAMTIHSHPFALPTSRSRARGFTVMAYPQPSQYDINYANAHNLPGMVVSHKGNFYYLPKTSPSSVPTH